MTLIFDFDICTFLGLNDSAVFHCMLCLFVPESYWKVMICPRISRSSLIFSSMSSQNLTWFCFRSSDKILGIILAHTFHIPRSCSKIVHTDSPFGISSSDIICIVYLQSLCTSCFALVMFSSVFIVKGYPILGLFSTSLQPFSKHLCYSKICIHNITSSP